MAPADHPAHAASTAEETTTVEENLQAIKEWELATLHSRSPAEQLSDWIASIASTGPFMAGHVVWFAGWITVNLGLVSRIRPFDPFPFPFLTMTVSLEAIFLTLFVLASQNRLSRQSDKRSHLDLQIDLLSEREMTTVLQLLRDISAHLNVRTSVAAEQLHDLARKTDIQTLTDRMEEFDGPPDAARASDPASDRQLR